MHADNQYCIDNLYMIIVASTANINNYINNKDCIGVFQVFHAAILCGLACLNWQSIHVCATELYSHAGGPSAA